MKVTSSRALFLLVPAVVVAAVLWIGNRAEPSTRFVVHYHGGVSEGAFAAYQDLLDNAPDNFELVGVVASESDANRLRKALRGDPRLRLVSVRRPLSPWARDRYILFQRHGHPACLAPNVGSIRPHMQGDAQVPEALRDVIPNLEVIRSDVAPIGGDTLVLPDTVLVGYESIKDADARTGIPRKRILAELERTFDRRVLVVGSAAAPPPRPHIDLFMADAGQGRIVVTDAGPWAWPFPKSDVSMGSRVTIHRREQPAFARSLDLMAGQLRAAGFDVVRVPGIFSAPPRPGAEPITLTYTNVERIGDTVYLPRYGLPALDALARRTWEKLGYRVAPIDVRGTILYGGAVRCLTNRLPE